MTRYAASKVFRPWLLAEQGAIWYIICMNQAAKEILRRAENWPQEDQEELAEVAREIEARRTGVYVLNDAERAALERGGLCFKEFHRICSSRRSG